LCGDCDVADSTLRAAERTLRGRCRRRCRLWLDGDPDLQPAVRCRIAAGDGDPARMPRYFRHHRAAFGTVNAAIVRADGDLRAAAQALASADVVVGPRRWGTS
jgi:hypothetical protein